MSEQETSRILTDIRERMVRVETKIDNMTDVRETAEEAKERANEALQYGKSAHRRLDDLADNRIAAVEDNQKWLWRTVVGAVIAGAITLLWKGVG